MARRTRKPDDPGDSQSPRSPSRRRLIKAAVYTPPAIIGTLLISREAMAQGASCQPQSCLPNTGPCQPQGCSPRN